MLSLAYSPDFVQYESRSSESYTAHRFGANLKVKTDDFSVNLENGFNVINGSKYGPLYPGSFDSAYATAAAREGAPGDPFALAYRLGTVGATDRLLLAGEDAAMIQHWPIPVLPLKGGEIVARGLAGPDVARVLRAVENAWIAEGFPDAARVQALCEAAITSRQ